MGGFSHSFNSHCTEPISPLKLLCWFKLYISNPCTSMVTFSFYLCGRTFQFWIFEVVVVIFKKGTIITPKSKHTQSDDVAFHLRTILDL
jgi:hypothetical protein